MILLCLLAILDPPVRFHVVERWNLPRNQHGQQLLFLEPNITSVCHYQTTPPALQTSVGENSTLYMFPPQA